MTGKYVKLALVLLVSASLIITYIPGHTHSWSNGGYSDDPSNPDCDGDGLKDGEEFQNQKTIEFDEH